MTTDCLDEDFALAMVEQRVDADARRIALGHAARCDDCRRMLAALVRAIPTTSSSGDPDAVDPIEIGTHLGPYVVDGWLGRGGVGVVYVGRDARLDRRVALKLLARTDPDAAATRRFVREARNLARLSHPHIVGVHDVGRSARGLWIAMELVEGTTLDTWIAAAPRTRSEVLAVFRQAAAGLSAAHSAGIVHRDFKPHNVMVGRDPQGAHAIDRVRVLDFGLAAALERSSVPDDDEAVPEGRTGVVGTPTYMAPEQFAGLPADARSDQFSFCVALWEALVGARPFAATSYTALATAVSVGRIADPGRRIPPRLEAVLRRGLAVDPGDRFASIDELVRSLDRAERSRSWPAIVSVVGALAVGLAAFIVLERPREPCERAAARLLDEVHEHGAALPLAVVTPLRERAAAWGDAFRTACAADRAHASAETTARLACLADRRAEIEALLHVLDSEPREPESALGSLTPLAVCEDPEHVAEAGLPVDPELARRVQSLRQRIAAASAGAELRLDHGFRATFTAFVDEADAIGWPPLCARVRETYGSVLAHYDAFAEAIPMLETAYFMAKESGEAFVEFDAAVRLLSSEGNHLGHHEPALVWARHAEAALVGLDDATRASKLLKIRGELYQAMHRYDEAETDLRRALELVPDDAPPYERATALGMLGNLFAEQWRCEEAVPLYERALQLDPPPFAALQSQNGLAVCQIQLERHDEAIATIERALSLAQDTDQPASLRVQLLANLAVVHGQLEQYELAITALDEAYGLSVAAFGVHSNETRAVAYNLALYSLEMERLEPARWWAERVLDAPPGEQPSPRMQIQGAWVLMEAHRRSGRTREAITAWESRIAVREREADVEALAEDLDDMAELCDEAGRSADAEAARRRAAELRADT